MNGEPPRLHGETLAGRSIVTDPARVGEVAELESELAATFGTRYAVAVNSGTAAIHCALVASGVGPGDDVLVPAVSVVMSVAPILYCGARPVFVDCPRDGIGMDVDDLAAKTTRRTKAVEAVYLWGRSGSARELAEAASADGLALIEDSVPSPRDPLRRPDAGQLRRRSRPELSS